jgi:glycosyltransferase involved in cell wall biosynthesis
MSYRLGFVMEQTLGHVTHSQNFQRWVAEDHDVIATWIPVEYHAPDRWQKVPVVKDNWTLRASLQARDRIQAILRMNRLDGLFFHTQLTAVFARSLMTRIPSVVSMDATPLNFDSIGVPYHHMPSDYRPIEAFKNALNRRTFNCARRLLTWHEWGKRSLISDYGVAAEKVAVIPPGIDLDRWHFPRDPRPHSGPVRLLFVGGNFWRKGGETMLTAFRRDLERDCELDIVTGDDVDTQGSSRIRVHHGLGPNTPALMDLFARADIFLLPTFGDTLPLVIMEAMASGLPVVATSVGAIVEEVEHGVTGFLISPGDDVALAAALRQLVASPDLRSTMGAAARHAAGRLFDGSSNYAKVLAVCKRCVDAG